MVLGALELQYDISNGLARIYRVMLWIMERPMKGISNNNRGEIKIKTIPSPHVTVVVTMRLFRLQTPVDQAI
jgi:hypothetical protein